MKNVYLVFFLFLILFSCKDDSPEVIKEDKELVNMRIYFTEYPIMPTPDLWLMATDKDGNILASKHWKNETNIILNGKIAEDEKVNILLFRAAYDDYYDRADYLLQVYSDIEPGRIWQLGKTVNLTSQGTTSVTFTDVPDWTVGNTIYGYQPGVVSTSLSLFNNSIGSTSSTSFSNNIAYQAVGTYSIFNPAKMLFFSYSSVSGVPSYFETDTLKVRKFYSYDYKTVFVPFDHVLELNYPSPGYVRNTFIGAIKGSEYFAQGSNLFTTNKLKLGYNNGFDNYFVKFSAYSNEKMYNWNVLTSAPTAEKFNFPVNDFTIANNSLTNFTSKIDWNKNFESRLSQWGSQWQTEGKDAVFNIFACSGDGNGNKILTDLPDDILTAYPDLKKRLADVKYVNSEFTFNEDGRTYKQKLEKDFSEDVSLIWRTSYSILK